MPCPLGCPGADVHSGQQLGHSQEASSRRLSVSRVPAVDTGTQLSSGLQGAPRPVPPARRFRCDCWRVGQVRPTPIPVVLIKTRSESRPESCRRTSRPLACRECITDDWVDKCAARGLASRICVATRVPARDPGVYRKMALDWSGHLGVSRLQGAASCVEPAVLSATRCRSHSLS